MRRGVLAGAVVIGLWSLVATSSATAASGAGADRTEGPAVDLPAGFTDGRPVGAEELAPQPGERAPSADAPAAAAAPTQRYFGRDPFAAVEAAAHGAARPCSLSDDGLTAMVVAPVFKESSAATTPATAPAPMTLSRFDEWTGSYPPPVGTAPDTNANANYGLYAFGDPATAYRRAFWHPGIGIWQYDSAGVGAPFTTIETMDVGIMAADVARSMLGRYCAAAPGSTPAQRRIAAWSPWGVPCTACEAVYQDLTATDPAFAALHLVDGITVTGGVEARTCVLDGAAAPQPCWYVQPTVGVIEGATAWATLDPSGGSSTVAPTPLSTPFYVVDRGATEERHWLRADSGYAIDISAERTIGTNARPRASQPGSGLRWRATSGLCDLTAGRGACLPVPPAGVTSTPLAVNGRFRAVPLDADGDGLGDVLWYAAGPAADHLWRGTGRGGFASTPAPVSGTFDDVLAGDVDGDGRDDVLWYARASGTSYLWRSGAAGSFTSTRLRPGSGLRPILVDVDGDDAVEVFWYGPGSLADRLWQWNGAGFSSPARPTPAVAGTYVPIVGDVDGNGRDDIFWYAAGPAADHLWLFTGAGSVVSRDRPVSGRYAPSVGDLDGDGRSDILWYAPGTTADHVWFGGAGGAFVDQVVTVDGTYRPVIVDLAGDGRDDVLWYAPGSASDAWWRWSGDRTRAPAASLALAGTQEPVVGAFSAGGADGILWYGSGAVLDAIWWR